MDKKGQITIFIILGLVIIIALGIFMYLRVPVPAAQEGFAYLDFESATSALRNYVEECAKNSANHALYAVGAQGGYIQALDTTFSVPYQDYRAEFLNYKGIDRQMSADAIESVSLSIFMAYDIRQCVNFSLFPQLQINDTFLSVMPVIKYDLVEFNISYPIVMRQENKEKRLDDIFFTVPVRLGKILEIVNHTVQTTIDYEGRFDATYIAKQDIEFSFVPYGESSTIFIITDTKSSLDGKNYTFVFGAMS